MRGSSSRWVALAAAVGVVLSACSSTDRMAAPAAEDVVSDQGMTSSEEMPVEPDSDETSAELDVDAQGERAQAFARGVRLCVINSRTTRDGKLAWIDVKFSKADRVSRDGTFVAPGDQICGQAGWEANLFSVGDLLGSLTTMYDDTRTAELRVINYAIGETSMEMVMSPTAQSKGISCIVFKENSSEIFDDSINRFTLKRLPDSSSFKEYSVTVSDSQSSRLCFPGYY